MQVSPVTSKAETAKAESQAPESSDLNGDAFLTLLVAQLRSQSPFEPMDPMQFVNQLVQFNLLEQTIRIRQNLDSQVAGSGANN